MSLTKHGAIRLVLEAFGFRDLRSLSMVIKASNVPGHWDTDLVRFLRQAVALDIARREKEMGTAILMQDLGQVPRLDHKQELRLVNFQPPLQGRYIYAVVSTQTIEHDGWDGARHAIMPYDPNGDVKLETSSGQTITMSEPIFSSEEEENAKKSTWQDFLEDEGYLVGKDVR